MNNNKRLPMQSVYKFPLALAVLNEVDKGKLSLDQKIPVAKSDLRPDTWSPLRDVYPNGGDISVGELLSYTVSQSDNNGCDILFRLIGGTKPVETYVRKNLGVKDIRIAATEEEMSKDERVQFTNWSKPSAMLRLVVDSYRGKYLSKSSNDFLWKIMTETSTGTNRIKGLLPKGTAVGHKTGTSGTNGKGVAAATNDAGIVTLPRRSALRNRRFRFQFDRRRKKTRRRDCSNCESYVGLLFRENSERATTFGAQKIKIHDEERLKI